MGLVDPKRTLTPGARTAFELLQLVLWIGGVGFGLAHFLFYHTDAQAAASPAKSQIAVLEAKTTTLETKVDNVNTTLQDFAIDIAVIEDRLQIPESHRGAAQRIRISRPPVNASGFTPP